LEPAASATTLTLQYFFASTMAFFDHAPVLTMSTTDSGRVRFSGIAANCAVAPPCRNSTL
jgi:hypothetical protein